MLEEKYIGLALALSSSLAIGTSFIITKKGLIDAGERQGFSGDDWSYLRNPIWWVGMVTMIVGELANFAAYSFAPAVLVTPLGALSVLIGATLAAFFLNEKLGEIGRLGCALCLIGAIIITLHAPPDRDIKTVDEIWSYALKPGFLLYCLIIAVFALIMIYVVSPRYGRRNPLVYISICSTVGSISIMAIKGFGVAIKLTINGNNQLTHVSTYLFGAIVAGCILVQLNYFNKALDQFDTSVVNPLYYVFFTTATLIASCVLFQGLNTSDPNVALTLICGLLVIFSGVYMINVLRKKESDYEVTSSAIPMENGISSVPARKSLHYPRRNSNKYVGLPKKSDTIEEVYRPDQATLEFIESLELDDDREAGYATTSAQNKTNVEKYGVQIKNGNK